MVEMDLPSLTASLTYQHSLLRSLCGPLLRIRSSNTQTRLRIQKNSCLTPVELQMEQMGQICCNSHCFDMGCFCELHDTPVLWRVSSRFLNRALRHTEIAMLKWIAIVSVFILPVERIPRAANGDVSIREDKCGANFLVFERVLYGCERPIQGRQFGLRYSSWRIRAEIWSPSYSADEAKNKRRRAVMVGKKIGVQVGIFRHRL